MPISYPAEQPGMQGGNELVGEDLEDALNLLNVIYEETWEHIDRYVSSHDPEHRLHKSVLNRYLEPFRWHTVVVTSTEWDNFFKQRCSPLAQPEMRVVAEAMEEAYNFSEPNIVPNGGWHVPYVSARDVEEVQNFTSEEYEMPVKDVLLAISAARCARVSRERQGSEGQDIEADLKTYERLITADPPHASPLEHVATPCPEGFLTYDQHLLTEHQGNFVGWDQLRGKVWPKENSD